MQTLRVRLFGPILLETPDGPIQTFGSRQAATLLAIASLQPCPVPRAQLLAALWPDDDPESARPRLRQELFRLKRALGDHERIISIDRESVALRRDLVASDLSQFVELVQVGRNVEGEARLRAWIEAERLCAGDLLPDYEGGWVEPDRRSTRAVLRHVLLGITSLLVDSQKPMEALPYAKRAAKIDPEDEDTQLALASVLCAIDDVPSARECLRRFESRMRASGRYEPSEAVRALWQVIGAASRSRPPLRDKREPNMRLPRPLNPFFGREIERAELVRYLNQDGPDARRLVSVTGFGGIGKTRLAQEVALAVAESGRAAVGYVSLVEVSEPGVMLQNIAAVVCNPSEPTHDLFSAIASQLADRPTVLVLDNFEDLAPHGADAIARLLDENPLLRLLVTSRTPLGLLSEQLYPLSPLPLPIDDAGGPEWRSIPSVALFLDQTLRVRPDFIAEGAAKESVTRLVGALEGIPLALLLAACRMRTLTPSDAERAISDRLAFLSKPQSGFEARHRTMRACIEWSSDGLPPDVRDFWIRLAIFRGGWTLAAAEAVLDEPAAIDYLEQLCDSSLVQRQSNAGSTRYVMFEPVRQFAQELLDPERREQLTLAHAAYFVGFLQEASKGWFMRARGDSFETVEAELDNVRAALEWSVIRNQEFAERLAMVMRTYWSATGHHAEGLVWIPRVLNLPVATSSPERRARLMTVVGIMAMDQADYERARTMYEGARVHAELSDNPTVFGWIDLNLAHLDILQGTVANATPLQERALALFTRLNDRGAIAHAMSDLGGALVDLQEQDRGLALLDGALEIRREVGWDNGIAFALSGIGSGLLRVNRLDEAFEQLLSARDYVERIRDARILIDVLIDLSECAAGLGELDEAERAVADLRSVCRKVGDRRGAIYADIRDAQCRLLLNEMDGAAASIQMALEAACRLGIYRPIFETAQVAAQWALRQGRPEDALALALGIDRLCESLGVSLSIKKRMESHGIQRVSRAELDFNPIRRAESFAVATTLESLRKRTREATAKWRSRDE